MTPTRKKIALLWDIDGTLLNTRGIAARQLAKSFQEVTGSDCTLFPGQYSGFTDYEIVLDLLHKAFIHPEVAKAEEILNHYGARLLEPLINTPPELLAEIQSVFHELEKIPYLENYIGSGNSKLGAYAKIKAAGLERFFEPNSYFISTPTTISRDSVIQKAATSIKIPVLLIGDSDRDISAAKKNHLKVLAVATGYHTCDVLRNLSPDYILDKNWSVAEFLRIISAFRENVSH